MAEEVPPSVLKKTQEILGSVIKRPPLTEKNLKRPPFRFLHDIITNIIRSTGFMKGLYSSEEMLSENVKDKESKIVFLQKAVDLLSIVTNQPVNLKPTKVVAGHEAQKTNEFLQILGSSARSKLDTKEAVQAVLQSLGAADPKERRPSVDKRSSQRNPTEKTHMRSTTKTIDPGKKPSPAKVEKSKEADKARSRSKDGKSRDKDKAKEKSRPKRDDSKSRSKTDSKREKSSRPNKDASQRTDVPEESPVKRPAGLQNGFADDQELGDLPDVSPPDEIIETMENKAPLESHSVALANDEELEVSRPKTELSERVLEEKRPHVPSAHQTRPPSARSKRTKLDAHANELNSSPTRTLDFRSNDGALSPLQRPPSARPSSSRPAPPRIRIRHIVENDEASIRPETAKPVENVIVDQKGEEEDEDETFVVAEEQPEDIIEQPPMPISLSSEVPDEDKGALVKQLLETKKDLEGGSQLVTKKVEIDKSQAVVNRARESSSKELEQLQSFIQGVSKTAYPLGRMLDYLQEDIDSMKMELKMWQEEHKQNLAALRKEQNITETALQPLRIQLDDLDQLVQDQLDANSALKATILRNEERMHRMLMAVRRTS